MHINVCDLMSVESFGGSRYFFTFINDYNCMSWMYFLNNNCIKILCFDRSGEFIFNKFNVLCEKNDIRRELMAPYIIEQNKVAKGKN